MGLIYYFTVKLIFLYFENLIHDELSLNKYFLTETHRYKNA